MPVLKEEPGEGGGKRNQSIALFFWSPHDLFDNSKNAYLNRIHKLKEH
jgi:hypothetical protein